MAVYPQDPIPADPLFSTGNEDCSDGGGRPREICMFRTAERYVLIVCGASTSLASTFAK